jgi:hypothetical protein
MREMLPLAARIGDLGVEILGFPDYALCKNITVRLCQTHMESS